jgi:phosphatidyl-myo-inositol dimannoside synthase
MIRRVLLLAPSRGLGGGIERYVETREWSFAAQDVPFCRINLTRATVPGHARVIANGRAQLRAHVGRVRVVAAHRSLLPAAAVLARDKRVDGISVVCHGNDVWGSRHPVRRGLQGVLMRRQDVRVVAVSSFTAGALWRYGPANVLPPGLSADWFETLETASAISGSGPGGVRDTAPRIVTAFRLSQWRDKGLPELMEAVASLGHTDIQVTVCGSGPVPADLTTFVIEHAECRLRPNLADHELARELAGADLFVLATRTRGGRHPSGEGFGLVLLEAQAAGTAVVGPAYAGSRDAYLDGVTGATPADEGAGALAKTMAGLLRDPYRLEEMGKQAAEWARACFAPELSASRAVARLL